MTYRRTPIKAPRLSGGGLRALIALAEIPGLGALVRQRLLAETGLGAMREVDAGLNTPSSLTLPLPEPAPAAFDGALGDLGGSQQAGLPTIADFSAAYREGRVDPRAVAERLLSAIEASESGDLPLRAFVAQAPADLRAQAEASAARYAAGAPLSVLDGVPVAVKDELDQTPYPTTVGTRFLGTSPAREDAEVVARLRAAGALMVGKLNMHELGIGVTGINPHHGPARNPHDPGRITGGSSSASAAAVAAGLCPLSVGADGGGSIRIPAALCGVVGLKATYGRISEHGAAPLCWSVAHVGPLGYTVRDVAIGYALMAGPDPKDPQTLGRPPVSLERFGDRDLAGVRIGVWRPWFEDAEPEVVARCREALEALTDAGAELREVTLPSPDEIRPAHLTIIVSEMLAAQQMDFDRRRREYGGDTRLNFLIGGALSATDYVHARRIRASLFERYERAFCDVDAIVTPTTGIAASPIHPGAGAIGESDLPILDAIMRFVREANLFGYPAISAPAGLTSGGLPAGLQLMGRPWREDLLLRMADVVGAAIPTPLAATRWDLLAG